MAHDLYANNKELESFHMAGSWTHLLEQCGAYFTCMLRGARWYMLYDERMTTHTHYTENDEREQVIDQEYPTLLCNCGGFEVTPEETHVLARIARNYATIQRSIPDQTEEERDRIPEYMRPFPIKIREDWVEQYEQFAEWAEQSQGFKVH